MVIDVVFTLICYLEGDGRWWVFLVFLRIVAKSAQLWYHVMGMRVLQPRNEVAIMDFSRIRQRISELRDEQDRLLDMLMRPKKMVRGSLTWQGKGEQSADGSKHHANLVRNAGGKSETKRVRDAHVGMLKESSMTPSASSL